MRLACQREKFALCRLVNWKAAKSESWAWNVPEMCFLRRLESLKAAQSWAWLVSKCLSYDVRKIERQLDLGLGYPQNVYLTAFGEFENQ